MFAGIVEALGIVKSLREENGCRHFTIEPQVKWGDVRIGDSVSLNGTCLTLTAVRVDSFDCSAVPETLMLTNLSGLVQGSRVNLERALKVGDRIGGHYVQGHVDGTVEISAIESQGDALLVKFQVAKALGRYIVKKGYVALDGMSITIVDAALDSFSVTFIPHTQEVTLVRDYRVGDKLNLEVDILGKYAEKLLEAAHDRAL